MNTELYTVIDIETTGMSLADEILSAAYIRTDQYANIISNGVLYFYQPYFRIETPAQKVHHLDRSFLKNYEKDFRRNLAGLYALCMDGRLVTKNGARFDGPQIREFLARHTAGADIFSVTFSQSVLESLDMQIVFAPIFRAAYKKMTGQAITRPGKLEEYIQVLGMLQEQVMAGFNEVFKDENAQVQAHSHDAAYDVYMTYLVFKEYIKRKEASNAGMQ